MVLPQIFFSVLINYFSEGKSFEKFSLAFAFRENCATGLTDCIIHSSLSIFSFSSQLIQASLYVLYDCGV